MNPLRSQIILLIAERLSAISGIAEVEVMPSGDPVSFPALHIFDPGHDTDTDTALGVTRYDMSPYIEGYHELPGGRAAYEALNAIYAEVVSALVSDPPLDGLAETIDEGDMRMEVATLASNRRLGFSLKFNITFPTSRSNPAETA